MSPSNPRRRARPGLGTLVDISLTEADPARAAAAFDAAFAAVARVDRLMSAFDPASDVRRLSEAAHRGPLRVDPQTVEVLRLAHEVHAASGGIFDVTVGAALAGTGRIPALNDGADRTGGSSDDILVLGGDEVAFRRPLQLDLGGVAKGYAVDCAVAALCSFGIASGLVNAGGDMHAFGAARHPVQLRFAGGVRSVALLADGALAASCHADGLNAGGRGSADAGVPGPHVDARCGRSVRSHRSVVVQAPRAALADALTKVALACPRTADRACARLQAEWREFDYFAA